MEISEDYLAEIKHHIKDWILDLKQNNNKDYTEREMKDVIKGIDSLIIESKLDKFLVQLSDKERERLVCKLCSKN